MSHSPLVSICIPTFEGADFLREGLESAARQTYRPLEIVVSDAQSTDGTLAIVATFIQSTDLPVHLYHFSGQGIGANWNHCIERAKGAYIKLLFQDDRLHPECVMKMMGLAQRDKRIGILSCTHRLKRLGSRPAPC